MADKFPAGANAAGSDWAFGAGAQAVTFVSRVDAQNYVEHGMSYYPALRRMALTPGHASPAGVRYATFSPDANILRCFLCHSTGTPRVNASGQIEPREPGVRCEVCHGAGAEHVKAPGRGNIINPARYSGDELNQMCGSCHRKPAAAGAETDYDNPWNVRHQPLYLARSACFLKSQGKLTCLTCHPPHGGATRSVCRDCHSSPRHQPRTATAGKRCETCHMKDVSPMPGLRFANHWIR